MSRSELLSAVRSLRRSPGYAIAAILVLALGIGANTAVFSLLSGILLEPLPYQQPSRLVVLRQAAPLAGQENVPFSIKEVRELQDGVGSLSALVEHHSMSFTLLGRGEPQRVSTGVVSAGFFDTLGVQPLHGRTFVDGDDDLGAEAVLVLSHPYFQRAFGGDAGVVGQVFEMNNRPHTVVGVLPPIPQYPVEHDVYMPTSACPFRATGEARMEENRSSFRALTAFGRLAPDVEAATLRAELGSVATRFRREHPETYPAERGYELSARGLQDELVRDARSTLLLLLLAATLVLLLACANVANLLLARALRGARETAVRAALGAGRWHLLRRSLMETGILAAAGCGLGVGMAAASLGLLRQFLQRFTPRAAAVDLDWRVLAFAVLVSAFVALAVTLAPLLSGMDHRLGALREGTRAIGGGRAHRLRAVLVAGQVAVAVLLLVGAGLLGRSLLRLEAVDAGVDAERILTARVALNWSKYTTAADGRAFLGRLQQRLEERPEIAQAAIASVRPMAGQAPFLQSLTVEGVAVEEGTLEQQVALRVASGGFFETLRVPVLAGRAFDARDDAEGESVVMANSALAERYGGADLIGRRVSLDGGQNWLVVVGISGPVRLDVEEPDGPALWVPLEQAGFAQTVFVKSAVADVASLPPLISETVHAMDPEQPVDLFETLEATRRSATAGPRVTGWLVGLFALLSLLVAAVGLAGLIAYSVSQRRREIGVRLALGATRRTVLEMIWRSGIGLAVVGIGIGLGGALLFGRVLRSLLFEVGPGDPTTYLLVALVALATVSAATLLPALRATRVDPTEALRAD